MRIFIIAITCDLNDGQYVLLEIILRYIRNKSANQELKVLANP